MFRCNSANIQREGNSGRILVILPGARDMTTQDLLSSTAR